MRTLLVGLVVSGALVAGCAAPSGEPEGSCPDDVLHEAAFAGAEDFAEDMLDWGRVAFAMTMVGTIEGEVDNVLIKLDPSAKAVHLRSNEGTIILSGAFISYSDDEESWYARDHDPDMFEAYVDNLLEDDEAELSFLDDLTSADYVSSCMTLQGTDVIEFRYEKDGLQDTFVVEGSPPYRLVSGTTIDPQLQDNFRYSVTYDRPSISVDSTLPRMPITWYLDADVSRVNDRGGIHLDATFTDDSEWAPFRELEFHLVDDAMTVYGQDRLDDAAWDLEDGDVFEFRDQDNNQMLSAGDRIVMDLGPGLDIMFYDLWADQYTFSE